MKHTVGIIGGGPRGLSAMESLCTVYASSGTDPLPHIDLFEPLSLPGAGQVYPPDQSPHNWLNVAERLIDLPERAPSTIGEHTIAGFPSYWQYAKFDHRQWDAHRHDRYPTRAELGDYLSERFNTLAESLTDNKLLTWHRSQVVSVQPDQGQWRITDSEGNTHQVRELAITAGHQPTEPDEQMAQWMAYADSVTGIHCVADPFPAGPIQALVSESSITRVALRGFGLTLIDVVKNLTEGLGGSYKQDPARKHALVYKPSGREPEQLIPFSLDGLPLGPKPANQTVDEYYALTDSAVKALSASLKSSLKATLPRPMRPVLTRTMAKLAVEVFLRLGDQARSHDATDAELITLADDFLNDAEYTSHALIDRELEVREAMEGYLGMAYGQRPASLDYCIGQVWRHAQPTLYRTLSYELDSSEDLAEIIALDERMKRYAFGPPPASLERLLALNTAGILSLAYVNDPGIDTQHRQGWIISSEEHKLTAQLMIDTVLDSTTVTEVNSPLFKSLIDQHLIEPAHPGLGVAVRADGTVIVNERANHLPPIAVLGRLAQGSLVGVDAILECFGERQDSWASGVIERFGA